MHSEDYIGYEYNPRTIISDLISYDKIYDEYLDGIEELIEKEKANFSSEIQLVSDGISSSELEPIEITKYRNFWDSESGQIDYFNKKLPSLIRGSALITLFSIFENNLKMISDIFFRFSKMNISFLDLKGQTLDKFKIVFRVLNHKVFYENEIYMMSDTIFSQKKFNVIKMVNKIRNCFAHSDGMLGGNKTQEMVNAIKTLHLNSYFKIDGDILLIEKGALHFIAQTMRDFFDEIFAK